MYSDYISKVKPRGGGGVLPYKGLMGTCGQPGYVFRDFCLEQGIEFITFCLNQGIDLSIFFLNWVKCLKQGIKNRSDICLKQGQGMGGRAAPPQPGIHRVPPSGSKTHNRILTSYTLRGLKSFYTEGGFKCNLRKAFVSLLRSHFQARTNRA